MITNEKFANDVNKLPVFQELNYSFSPSPLFKTSKIQMKGILVEANNQIFNKNLAIHGYTTDGLINFNLNIHRYEKIWFVFYLDNFLEKAFGKNELKKLDLNYYLGSHHKRLDGFLKYLEGVLRIDYVWECLQFGKFDNSYCKELWQNNLR